MKSILSSKEIYLTLLFLHTLGNLLFANNDTTLVVEDILKNKEKALETSRGLLNTDPDKSIDVIEKLINETNENEEPEIVVEAYQILGEAYTAKIDDKKALEFYLKAHEISKEYANITGEARSLNSIGLSYYYLNDFEKARDYFKESLEIATANKLRKEKASALRNLGNIERKEGNHQKALEFYRNSYDLWEKLNDKSGMAKTLNSIGLVYYDLGKYDEAVEAYKEAYVYRESSGDIKGSGILLNNIGNIYLQRGIYEEALKYYQEALEIFEKIDFKEGVSSCQNNIGLIYENIRSDNFVETDKRNFQKALEYHFKALETRRELENENEIANSLNNIGNVTSRLASIFYLEKYGEHWEDSLVKVPSDTILEKFSNTLSYYQQAMDIKEQLGDKFGIASILNNIGWVYSISRKKEKALNYFQQAYELNVKINNKPDIALNLFEIAQVYKYRDEYEAAIEYFRESLDIAEEIELNELRQNIYHRLAMIHQERGEYKEAFEYHKKYTGIKDTLLNKQNLKEIEQIMIGYETEKKEQQINLQQARIKQQKTLNTSFLIGIFVITIFMILLIRNINQKKKANKLLAEKNEIVLRQKTAITDSIEYASRIQSAVLTPREIIEKLVPENFILFKPRDIVSGDFYWVSEKNGKVVVVAADCTGHGVPGAFMSMLGVALLNEIVNKHDVIHANEILQELREKVITSLHQTGLRDSTQDGMDLALYILDLENKELEYAGANNSLLLFRNDELIEVKADKMPIGIHVKADRAFTNHVIELEKGDMLYTFSDGYPDQFGGPNGKKFMIKNFRTKLKEIKDMPLSQQKVILDVTIEKWMGDQSQIDDILVVGIRV